MKRVTEVPEEEKKKMIHLLFLFFLHLSEVRTKEES
jgi:hypothetical protein